MIKRDKYDAIVSDLVRIRADFTCEKCGIIDENGRFTFKSKFMHASHYYGRGTGNIARYSITNVRCLCATCHHEVENKPNIHEAFIRGILGDGLTNIMIEKLSKPCKLYKEDKQEMYQFYKAQYAKIRKARMDGANGYIECADYF